MCSGVLKPKALFSAFSKKARQKRLFQKKPTKNDKNKKGFLEKRQKTN